MITLDTAIARSILDRLFLRAETEIFVEVDNLLAEHKESLDSIFESKTQSYREVLLGCALVRLMNPDVNIRSPYAKQGDNAFNGRTLDEKVVNPFFQANLIPCSKGPYLATFRRNVKLTEETAEGLRDKPGYFSMLALLNAVEECDSDKESEFFIICLLKRFIVLRDASRIPLARITRMSVEQYDELLTKLLRCPSGGLLPVLLTVAFFRTLNSHYNLHWEVEYQGINVADQATGAAGDVTVKLGEKIVLAIEVTERQIDRDRIVSTFNTKIVNSDVKEYLFVYTVTEPNESARQAARNLFSQGYDINFASVTGLIINAFHTLPSFARKRFTVEMIRLLDTMEIPASVKMIWNDCVTSIVEI